MGDRNPCVNFFGGGSFPRMSGLNRERLRELIHERGITARALSKSIGDNPYLIRDILSGKSANPRTDTISRIASQLGVPVSELITEDEHILISAPSAAIRRIRRRIPILGEVAAGIWKETTPREIRDAEEHLDMDVRGYETAQLYALRVVGPSMNRVYEPGTYVVVAPAAEAGLRVGDHVIVERRRNGFVEVTVKELAVDENGEALLWPRSTHPDHQTPVPYEPTGDDATTIVGVVVARYEVRERPNVMFTPPGAPE